MRLIESLMPASLLARMILTLALGMVLTQTAVSLNWSTHLHNQARHDTQQAAGYLGSAAAATVHYFALLPQSYQPLVIDQLREMGGTRFFVTLNPEVLQINGISDDPLAEQARTSFQQALEEQLGTGFPLEAAIAWPEQLVTSEQGTLITELPRQWTEFSLLLQPKPAPILVAQISLENGDWLYLASLMPDPYFLDKSNPFSGWSWLIQLVPILSALVLMIPLTRSITKPLARLSAATHSFGRGLAHEALPETGSREYRNLRNALLEMERRIEQFITDRGRLFSSISHDLRTPITRLKLRTEMLDDPQIQQEFHEDLDDLSRLVTAALQSVKDTALDEPISEVRLDELLRRLTQTYSLSGQMVSIKCPEILLQTRVLALKRVLDNLINNALLYGDKVDIRVEQREQLWISIRDYGPGVDESEIENLIQPGQRLEHGRSRNQDGQGLGLTISHNLVLGLGGQLKLFNHPTGGLVAQIRLPQKLT